MRFNLNLIIAALLAAADALPQLDARHQDTCANAVSSGPRNLPTQQRTVAAKLDCSAFLGKTIISCPVTRTSTTTSVKTARPVTKKTTITNTKKSTITKTVRPTIRPTSVQTKDETQRTTAEATLITETQTTETTTSTQTVYQTVSITTTYSTDIIPSTVLVTSTSIPISLPVKKRELLPLTREPKANQTFAARGWPAYCQPTTKSGPIPAYASSCRGGYSYSSACARLGVKRGPTTTLPASTKYVTSTRCSTSTPFVMATVTKLSCKYETITVTDPITKPVTAFTTKTKFETTTTTTTVTVTVTITTVLPAVTTALTTEIESVIATSTSVTTSVVVVAAPTPPARCSFRLQALNGAQTGRYIGIMDGSTLIFTDFPTAAVNFVLDAQNRLKLRDQPLYADINPQPMFTVYLDFAQTIEALGFLYLTCDASSGALSCTASNGNNGFYHCANNGDYLLFGSEAGAAQYAPCTLLTLSAQCVPDVV